jgi:hypothetical protein
MPKVARYVGVGGDGRFGKEATSMSRWNQAPLPRDQILLFRETLGGRIPENHSVRLLAEILDGLDWSPWEQSYVLVAGQPPIHPKILAGAMLYGLSHGIRSSRRLECACGHAIDFMWLVEGANGMVWACTAFNLKKLAAAIGAMRAESAMKPG